MQVELCITRVFSPFSVPYTFSSQPFLFWQSPKPVLQNFDKMLWVHFSFSLFLMFFVGLVLCIPKQPLFITQFFQTLSLELSFASVSPDATSIPFLFFV